MDLRSNYGFESKAAFMNRPNDMVFNLTNQIPANLIGLYFHSLETGKTYMFTSLGNGSYCLVGRKIYNDPVTATGNKRVTALFVSRMFGTNNVIDYWKFVIKHKNPLNPPLFLKLQGVEYEFS